MEAPPEQQRDAIDLRSDTVTRPSTRMRSQMTEAIVGDDVFGDDPTVIALEKRTAELFGKESALFFPTGTMANLAAVMTWCSKRGSEMILGASNHIFLYEQGGMAQLAGVCPRTLPNNPDGTMDLDSIKQAIRADNIHYTTTELIAIENTHNYCGGRVLPLEYIASVSAIAKEKGIPLHVDGARIWNSANALDRPVRDLVEGVDSVSACLSKGLGAPAGSVLIGPSTFIAKARRIRKALGGGMRQVGVLAAAGMVALDDFESGILRTDHARARSIAVGISELPGFRIELDKVETNIVLIEIDESMATASPSEVTAMLKERGVWILPFGPNNMRLVTHRDMLDEDVAVVLRCFREISDLIVKR